LESGAVLLMKGIHSMNFATKSMQPSPGMAKAMRGEKRGLAAFFVHGIPPERPANPQPLYYLYMLGTVSVKDLREGRFLDGRRLPGKRSGSIAGVRRTFGDPVSKNHSQGSIYESRT
jgi:hypothetical protein